MKRRLEPNLAVVIGFVCGSLCVLCFMWWQFCDPVYRRLSESNDLRRLSVNAERHGQLLDILVKRIRDKGIECSYKVRDNERIEYIYDANGDIIGTEAIEWGVFEAEIWTKRDVNLLGLGSMWNIEVKVDGEGRVLEADVEQVPLGFP